MGTDLNDNNKNHEKQKNDQDSFEQFTDDMNLEGSQENNTQDNQQQDADKKEEEPTFNKLKKEAFSWVKDIVIAIIIVMLIRAFVGEPTNVFGQSMEPTLHENNRLFVSKLNYRFGEPQRGDIIIFYNEFEDKVLIKRIIALPGERYEIKNGKVYINGSQSPIDEPYVKDEGYIEREYRYRQGIVPEGHIFVMGDNRNDSLDSREIGYIPVDAVIGEAVFRFWPVKEIQVLK